jgi:hypothetical protein
MRLTDSEIGEIAELVTYGLMRNNVDSVAAHLRGELGAETTHFLTEYDIRRAVSDILVT